MEQKPGKGKELISIGVRGNMTKQAHSAHVCIQASAHTCKMTLKLSAVLIPYVLLFIYFFFQCGLIRVLTKHSQELFYKC